MGPKERDKFATIGPGRHSYQGLPFSQKDPSHTVKVVSGITRSDFRKSSGVETSMTDRQILGSM